MITNATGVSFLCINVCMFPNPDTYGRLIHYPHLAHILHIFGTSSGTCKWSKQHRSYEPLIKLLGLRLHSNSKIALKESMTLMWLERHIIIHGRGTDTHIPTWDTLAISSTVIRYGKCTDTLSAVSSQLNMMNQKESNIETWAFRLRANVPWQWPQVTILNDRSAEA